MAKKLSKGGKRDVSRAATIKETALIVGVTTRQVQKVMNCESNNDKIVEVFMELTEGKNALMEQVKQLVPFKK